MSKTQKIEFADPADLVIVGLDTKDDETHELFDERINTPVDDNLVKNIMVYGVLQPIIVREEAGKKMVVDGRQRVRAAREALRKQSDSGSVKVRVPYTTHGTQGADAVRLTGVMVSANEQRKSDEILTRAAKASRMLALGASLDEVAIAFGRSTVTIRQWTKLLEASPLLLAAVRHELIAVSAAHEVAKYDKDKQPEVLRQLQAQAGEGRITETLAKAYRQSKGDSTASSSTTATATGTVVQLNNPNLSEAGKKAMATAKSGSTTATPATAPKGTKSKPRQSGVKRTWLRDSLKSQAANSLTDEQKGVLQWIASGLTTKGAWYDKFQQAVEAELSAKGKTAK